ncbi:SDR family oxidoreductase [Nocardiopsis coralliicola]
MNTHENGRGPGSGRATLVTGGSSGIGAALALRLLKQGGRVAVTGRGAARLDAFADRAGRPGELLVLPGDAAEEADVAAAVAAVLDRFGRLDAAVANAGFATHDDVVSGDPAGWGPMVLANVLGPALLVRAALPALRKSRGRLVLVGSVAGLVPTPGNLYGATKYAVTGLAENTRRAVAGDGVGVTLIAPGRVGTAFWDPAGGPPAGSGLTAGHVADAAVWALDQPPGVDVNTITLRPLGQAA